MLTICEQFRVRPTGISHHPCELKAMRTLLFSLALFAVAHGQPVTGRVSVAGSSPLQLVDGWAAADCSPRFLNVFLVPYSCPKRILESGKPYVQVCAWFPQRPDLKTIQMATFTVYGLQGREECKYSFNDSASARKFLSQLQITGKRWTFASAMQGVASPYPKVPSASWTVQATVNAPVSP